MNLTDLEVVMNQDQVRIRVAEVLAKAKSIWASFDGSNVSVDFFSKGSAAGLASLRSKRVSFNTVLMSRHPEDFDNTIIHEVAHLVTYQIRPNAKQAHGPEFKRIMLILGGSPNTYHTYDVSGLKRTYAKTRYVYECSPGCTHNMTKGKHDKIVSGVIYQCRHTGKRIMKNSFTGKVETI